jgi:hypothetical protein
MSNSIKHFKSDRKFSLFSYGLGHGPLLLRSGKTDEHPTRINILILDVRAMEIRSWFDSVEIVLTGQEYLRDFRSHPAEMMEPGLNAYSISSKGWQGFIVGGSLCVHEDEADFMAPGAFSAAETARPTDD